MSTIGIVIIGRNEGSRLRRCLGAVRRTSLPCVYVDSGSTDESVQRARKMIGKVVELDASRTFTAARGRNEGARALLSMCPNLTFIQFVDGDCTLHPQWVARACRHLLRSPCTAIVCGHLRERDPDASIYQGLCDIEWSRSAGIIESCGGIFLIRADALRSVEGFNASLRAGEEPELCMRLRQLGWLIERIDAPMAKHDAGMTTFGQWWRRAVRSGRCAMESAWMRGSMHERQDLRRVASTLLWTLGVPILTGMMTSLVGSVGWIAMALYPLQWVRLCVRHLRSGRSFRMSTVAATFTFIGKCAELFGVFQWLVQSYTSRVRTQHYDANPPFAVLMNDTVEHRHVE